MNSSSEEGSVTSSISSQASTSSLSKRKQHISETWTSITNIVHREISRFVLTLSLVAARNPKRTIGLITFVSFALIAVGFFTNFILKVDYEEVYAPFGSLPIEHQDWIDNESGFPETPRPLTFVIHNHGDNVLGYDQVNSLFEALDTVRDTPGYDEICRESNHVNINGKNQCKVFGATRFWDHSAEKFHQEIHSDEEAIAAMSAATYPGGTPVYTEYLFGYAKREGNVVEEGGNHNGALLLSAESYFVRINLPDTEGVMDFEVEVLEKLMALKEKWDSDPNNPLQLTYFTFQSYELEFKRAIDTDLILVPFVGLIMSAFTCLVFYKSDRVQSRSLLGLCSVAGIGLSLMSGYGIMFLAGVPFTSMSQILPFIIFGVGLDDTFIITGSYFRTDPEKDTIDRIKETMLEVGQSISLTTITTMTAFIVGCLSTIPAIRWVCIYAFPTLFIVFVYQITFFIACLVLDERRIQANKKDFCCCCSPVAKKEQESSDDSEEPCGDDMNISFENEGSEEPSSEDKSEGFGVVDKFMGWYSIQLMRPRVKAFVFAVFFAYFGFCVYCTTNLTQRFRTQDFVPEDSYVGDFLEALDKYSEQVLAVNVYFRNVNQSDPDVQWEMRRYMHDLMKTPAVNGTPSPFCWVIDFEERKNDPAFELIQNMSFSDQVSIALSQPAIKEAYGDDIVQDENGTIVTSRCWLNPKYLDMDSVSDQIDFLNDQQAVSLDQPANKGIASNMSFFTHDAVYFIWEFYSVAVNELVFTTISGIVSVALVGFVLIEHWTATVFVLPMILVLYVNLLGTLQFAGLYINVVTYVCMVISIGLLVDFLMHIILRYYESRGATREDKVKETLQTMGSSILVGGLSTFLGVIPLAFSTSAILRTVFTAFFAMVTLGLTHGLILLPVVLSLWGPLVCVSPHNMDPEEVAIDQEGADIDGRSVFQDLGLSKNKTEGTMESFGEESSTSEIVSVSEYESSPRADTNNSQMTDDDDDEGSEVRVPGTESIMVRRDSIVEV